MKLKEKEELQVLVDELLRTIPPLARIPRKELVPWLCGQALLTDLASKKPLHYCRCGIIPSCHSEASDPPGSTKKVVFFNWGINRQNEKGWVARACWEEHSFPLLPAKPGFESWQGACNSSASGIVPDQALRASNKYRIILGVRGNPVHQQLSTPLAGGKNWTVTEGTSGRRWLHLVQKEKKIEHYS